ncbi:MAG: alpha-glucan family phosphorylase [Candidatus Solibacter usitatus]|nr:alpha-glucan family phosphorylase [Candidatus Solibacter usitatus]
MPFQIQPVRQFLVRPALPPPLARLSDLAYNVLWSWEPVIRALFRRLDPALWKECGYNPVVMLGRVSQATLDKAAADHRYLAHYSEACHRFDTHMQAEPPDPEGKLIAYFSAEYGLTECLPIYSGGLGILSGDHLKSSSDCRVPLVGVGLLYQQGYFRQFLNPDGWQQERYLANDFFTLPILPVKDADDRDLHVSVTLPTGPVSVQVWRLDVGRVKLYLLDTNVRENALPQDRQITDQLYGGDLDTRIRQEIVLGIGGLRALRALGIDPTVYHMNEGHSAFLAVERTRLLMQEHGLSFDEALDASRANNVFTTHTPVPAGMDVFDAGMMHYYFQAYCRDAGIDFDQLMALGRRRPSDRDERFSMAVLAVKTSSYRNAVSKLHRRVSQELWSELWPGLPTWEVPITAVTNGVHLPSWLNGDLADLYDQYLQPDWREYHADPQTWALIKEIPDEELLEAHRRRKRRMIAFIRERQTLSAFRRKVASTELRYSADVLDPNVLTIGMARRFATYKRATLLFRDVERLKRILCHKDRPVQVIVAGKAHPKDHPGKTYIREVVQLSRDPDLWKHVVFVEDYDMKVGRELVQSVDIWLNTPRRGEEACGTSGMKAAMNGVLNLSVLDGWYDEAYEESGGWSIGDREPYSEEQDAIHSSAIYYLLENEIAPMFYDRRDHGAAEWMRRVKQSIMHTSPHFDCRRMVKEYQRELYEPAHAVFAGLRAGKFEVSRERRRWNAQVLEVWDRVRFVETNAGPAAPVMSGCPVEVRAAVELAGLKAEDVKVEVVIGRVGANGGLQDTEVMLLPPVEQRESVTIFGKQIVPNLTGRLGYALRISPNHYDDPLTRPCSTLLKWEAGGAQ